MSDKLKKIFEDDDMGLLKSVKRSSPQTSSDRLESSFLAIVDFYNENGREPSPSTTDISERKLGVGLRGIRLDDEKVELLKHLDSHNLLAPGDPPENIDEIFSEDDELGILDDPTGILELRNVGRSKKAAEDFVARRKKVEDFTEFERLFSVCHSNIDSGKWNILPFQTERQIMAKHFYVLNGLLAYVNNMGDLKRNRNGDLNSRLHVVFENGTESNMLLRSFAKQLHEDGRLVLSNSDADLPLLNQVDGEDTETGYIYVLSSLSEDPAIANIHNLYKVGFSTKSVEQRLKSAPTDPTYLMSDVKTVATYKTYNMNTQKFESLLHRVFNDARLDIEMVAKDGTKYVPTEWFIVPLDVIDTAIRMIISGDILNYQYDSHTKSLELKS